MNKLTNPRKKANILIVDNDLTVCKLFEVFLENAGHNSITTTSGLLAFEILKTQHVDLILLDVMMPEMDGFEICTRLQADSILKKIPVIFVTSIDDNESYIKGLGLGAIDYLNKPVNQLEFTVKIRNYLNLIWNEAELKESEKKFKNIFQSSGDGIIITNFDHEILEANESFQKRFELKGEKNYLISFIHYSDKKKYEKHFKELIKEESTSTPVEVRLVGAENKTLVYEIKHQVIEYQGSKAVLSILRDVTARNEMQIQILNTIMDTEEKERKRFAQDLHDGLGPLLSTIKLYSRSILSAKNEENKQFAVEKSIQAIDEAIASIKEIANNISPHVLRDFGLAVAINSYINKFNDANNLNISFQHDFNMRFETKIEVSLFRIIIELINNTYKHSYADNIIIGLEFTDNMIALSYADDGIGCDLNNIVGKSAGHGIPNIISRTKTLNGEIDFKTAIDMGFFVKINIPAALEV